MNKDYIPLIVAGIGVISTLIVGSISIAGVLLGALTNSLLNARNDRLKWQREIQARYDKDRATLYAKYAGRATEIGRIYVDRPDMPHNEKEEIRAQFLTLFLEVRLLGSSKVRATALTVYNKAGDLGKKSAQENMPLAIAESYASTQRFLEEARIELSITKTEDPETEMWITKMFERVKDLEPETASPPQARTTPPSAEPHPHP